MQMQCNCEYPYDTHHEVVINRAEFDACTCSSFRGVKTDRQTRHKQTELHFIYYLIFFIKQPINPNAHDTKTTNAI